MIKNLFFILIGFLFLACKSGYQKKSETGNFSQKPNILILHVDDLGYHDLSYNGSKIYQTPNIDRLASQSVVFTKAYANYPRCVPSRYAMMTGNYPIKDGDVPDDGFEMDAIPTDKNFIKNIKSSGYETAYFGKWHLGDTQSIKDFGFDFTFGAGKAGSPISFLYPFNTPKWTDKESKKSPIPDVDTIAKKGDYLMDVMTNNVIQFLKNRDKNKPFLTMFSFYGVHQPLEAKQDYIEKNKEEISNFDFKNQPEFIKEGTGRTKMRQNHPTYAAMVEILDDNVGKLLQTLKDLNIEENTIIVFSSDHGGLSNDGTKKRDLATSNYPLRAGKGWLYEGGIKVPLFFKWKNKFAHRTESSSTIMLMDVFPTLLDVVGNEKLSSDGKSFLPILNKQEDWNDRTTFWHSSKARPVNTGDTECSAIRIGDYKMLHWYKENRIELYNVSEDPYEKNNIAKNNDEITKKMLEKLNSWKANF